MRCAEDDEVGTTDLEYGFGENEVERPVYLAHVRRVAHEFPPRGPVDVIENPEVVDADPVRSGNVSAARTIRTAATST